MVQMETIVESLSKITCQLGKLICTPRSCPYNILSQSLSDCGSHLIPFAKFPEILKQGFILDKGIIMVGSQMDFGLTFLIYRNETVFEYQYVKSLISCSPLKEVCSRNSRRFCSSINSLSTVFYLSFTDSPGVYLHGSYF